jgi:hypothetical protein
VAAVSWSRVRGEECVRIAGGRGVDLRVRPELTGIVGELPAMAGEVVADGDDACFVPRFGFVDGTTYTVTVDGVDAGTLARPRPDVRSTTDVIGIHPSARVVPRNLLRLYVHFSAPMSDGDAADHVRLIDDAGDELEAALFSTGHELWDAAHVRLTVLLDPARIKRGLAPHRQVGYPLRPGEPFRVVVDAGFRDATGAPLRAPGQRRYDVGDDERRRVVPESWELRTPRHGTRDRLVVAFDRPLDHGLLARCLTVDGPDGHHIDATSETGPEERSWRLTPRAPWTPGRYRLVVDPVLEDVAGNSVARVFDRDLTRPDEQPRDAGAGVVLSWTA